MLNIIPSKLCIRIFSADRRIPAFLSEAAHPEYRSFPNFQTALQQDTSGKNLFLYTNILPVTNDLSDLAALLRLSRLNSAGLAAISSFDDSVERIAYPRKSDIYFPGKSIAFLTIHPGLLRNSMFLNACEQSVSHALFASLAFDVTFTHLSVQGIELQDEHRARFESEHADAARNHANLGFEIHCFSNEQQAPFARMNDPFPSPCL